MEYLWSTCYVQGIGFNMTGFVSLLPDLLLLVDICVSEPLIARRLQVMLTGTLPPTSKPQLLCQMVSSKVSASLTTEENMWCSSFALLPLPLCAPRRWLLSVIGRKN